jgi:hypothetical protein
MPWTGALYHACLANIHHCCEPMTAELPTCLFPNGVLCAVLTDVPAHQYTLGCKRWANMLTFSSQVAVLHRSIIECDEDSCASNGDSALWECWVSSRKRRAMGIWRQEW